jgi:lipoate---protein ligase
MRLPRHDTPLRLPAEPPREAIAADEALLDQLQPGQRSLERWWVAASPAVVYGLGLRSRLAAVVDLERCRAAAVEVIERRAGGGALFLDRRHMLCGAVCVHAEDVASDVTESYRWLGDHLATRLVSLGLTATRVDVDAARADVQGLRERSDDLARLLLATCYGSLSPHEVVIGGAKVVGLAQVRRRHAALFQIGVLMQDQSRLADYLAVDDERARAGLRQELQTRTVGLEKLTGRSISEVAAAIAGARPCVPSADPPPLARP